jgi:hypothetical protein
MFGNLHGKAALEEMEVYKRNERFRDGRVNNDPCYGLDVSFEVKGLVHYRFIP